MVPSSAGRGNVPRFAFQPAPSHNATQAERAAFSARLVEDGRRAIAALRTSAAAAVVDLTATVREGGPISQAEDRNDDPMDESNPLAQALLGPELDDLKREASDTGDNKMN